MSTISETNEGYTFESWDYEKSVVEDLYARIQNIENLIKNKTEMLEGENMSLRDIERDDMIINWKKSRLDYLRELKHVLIVGKQETKRQQQAGEGKTSDDEEGSTTLNVYLAGKIPWYEELLTEINEKINNSTPVKRERAKGGGKRRRKTCKKKSKKNLRMRKKTRRKRGGEGKKSKKKLTWGKEPERYNTPGSHYENPPTTRHYGTLPTENKNMTTQQVRARIAMRTDAAKKQKKLEKLAVAYTRRAKSRELEKKKRNPIKSLKKKVQKKLTLTKKSGPSNFQPDRIRKGVKYTSLGGRRKRKKKTRKRRRRRKSYNI